MKKRLREVMPHVPLLKLRPELDEQEKNDQESTGVTDSDTYRFNCCFFVKKIFCRKESHNDEIPLVEMN